MKACLVLSHNMEFDMNLRMKDAHTDGFIQLASLQLPHKLMLLSHLNIIIKQGSRKL